MLQLHNQIKHYPFILLLWVLSSCSYSPNVKNHDKTIGQYTDHGNGTITDAKTHLMWKKCSEGQTGNNCSGKPKQDNWANAKQKAKQIKFAGYTDWRLPSSKELDSLIYCSNATVPQKEPWLTGCTRKSNTNYKVPTINQQAFPNMVPDQNQYIYWSATTINLGGSSDNARIVDFAEGLEVVDFKERKNHLRFVRTIKK